ncbi:hypothetical protein VBM87_00830 [Mycoplasma sp. 744]|uniref:hypothetical protein n=1 Tax=Mycoplasma sp. 744 TaxID=3108531 RepID=UPI002B1DD6D5|nr:hypothetical protein [Mycoplasma sp. 744]MEA4115330.1 hypothetical protein [Mycoplasma sp. 744]
MKKLKFLLPLTLTTTLITPALVIACKKEEQIKPEEPVNPSTPETPKDPTDNTPSEQNKALETAKTNLQKELAKVTSELEKSLTKFSNLEVLNKIKETKSAAETILAEGTNLEKINENTNALNLVIQEATTLIKTNTDALNSLTNNLTNSKKLLDILKENSASKIQLQAIYNDAEKEAKAEITTLEKIQTNNKELHKQFILVKNSRDFLIGDTEDKATSFSFEELETEKAKKLKTTIEKAVDANSKYEVGERAPYTFVYNYQDKRIVLFEGRVSWRDGSYTVILNIKADELLPNGAQLINAIDPLSNRGNLSTFLDAGILDGKLVLRFKTGIYPKTINENSDFHAAIDLNVLLTQEEVKKAVENALNDITRLFSIANVNDGDTDYKSQLETLKQEAQKIKGEEFKVAEATAFLTKYDKIKKDYGLALTNNILTMINPTLSKYQNITNEKTNADKEALQTLSQNLDVNTILENDNYRNTYDQARKLVSQLENKYEEVILEQEKKNGQEVAEKLTSKLEELKAKYTDEKYKSNLENLTKTVEELKKTYTEKGINENRMVQALRFVERMEELVTKNVTSEN